MMLNKILTTCCADLPIPLFGGDEDEEIEEKKPMTIHSNSKPAPKKTSRSMPVVSTKFDGKDTKYEDAFWDDLPSNIREAAMVLGFDKESWDDYGWPESEEKCWGDLTLMERYAAQTLGYDITSWDTKYSDKNWKDVPKNVKEAAMSVGFTQELWDDDSWPEGLNKDWDELAPAEQKAVMVLGYNKWAWE